MSNELAPEDVTKETSLFDIFKHCHIYFANTFNLSVTALVLIAMIVYLIYGNVSHASYVIKIRGLADTGLSFVGNMLGFLIAGFTIFATFSDKELFMFMATKKHEKYGISYLKYSFFAFMYVFIIYLLFGTFCLLIKLFADKDNIALHVVNGIKDVSQWNKRYMSGAVHAILGTWFFYLFVILKAFIFNVYHVVVTRIRWELITKQEQQ